MPRPGITALYAIPWLLAACRLSSPLRDYSDLDHDGSFDAGPGVTHHDRCPTRPGPGNNRGCPYPDLDGDNVYDHLDGCPFERGGADGCRDHDALGSLDVIDECPTFPETRNGYRDHDGCPDELAAQLTRLLGIRAMTIHFDALRTIIKPRSRPVLDRLAAILRDFSTLEIEVVCHESREPGAAPASGPALARFTRQRADVVKQYLIDAGVPAGRITPRGAGWDEPIDSNRTPAGRARNRRCEFVPRLQ